MTLDSQHRLCRAGIIIGVLFCVAAVLEVGIGVVGYIRNLTDATGEFLQEPADVGRFAGEFIVTTITRLWPLPFAVLFLVPSLIWRHRLNRKMRALPR
ncbi:hypothetical protein DES53_106277 [Roseimicrobium gellanilyticum]|uniref:Uncharacterized protein n=1 Tax=Roseimicrobium gellanilyticum TaxID=748857 RepID=A0A366HIH6_9BACT|nr:hypothetical protein [Roseimicrobium gellanilyticum]RBP42568.1 hypothetical protein DES53_106277 [Roseimicrobium gellanilyticum]